MFHSKIIRIALLTASIFDVTNSLLAQPAFTATTSNKRVAFVGTTITTASVSKSTKYGPYQQKNHQQQTNFELFMSSFSVDGSDYTSSASDYDDVDDDGMDDPNEGYRGFHADDDYEDDPDVREIKPVPMSKNGGNRFVAFIWDNELDIHGRDQFDLHMDRDRLVEDHVMFCRKQNLYNETFNTESMVDIYKSLPILSSDLRRIVGSVLIMESTDIRYVYELMEKEPIIHSLTGGDTSKIQLYRWRHIRDHTLRNDDGRFGYPCMIIAMDEDSELSPLGSSSSDGGGGGGTGMLRVQTFNETMEYLVRSDMIIAAGPLYLPTEFKDDPSSIPVGDFIMFNAKNRTHAIDFAEDMPAAMAGLYKEMRVHFYNNLDVTGKYISEDPLRDTPCADMREAMEAWGYPVDDEQTPWLNW